MNRALRVRAMQEALAGRRGRAELFLDAAQHEPPVEVEPEPRRLTESDAGRGQPAPTIFDRPGWGGDTSAERAAWHD